MARPIDPDRLVTATEVARLAEVGPAAVHNWRARHPSFPAPVLDRHRLTLWDRAEVLAWLEETGRRAQ